jgi:hypothetical protein
MGFFRSTWGWIVCAAIAFFALFVFLALGPGNHCTQGSLCFEMAKGFPAAFVALVIGGVAAYIAWRQYKLAQEQHEVTRAKLKFDLLEKRYAIFEQTWNFLSMIVHEGPGATALPPFGNIIPQAGFLFGKEVEAYMREASEKQTELWFIESRMRANNNVMLPEDIDRDVELMAWFTGQASAGVKRIFAPYLGR